MSNSSFRIFSTSAGKDGLQEDEGEALTDLGAGDSDPQRGNATEAPYWEFSNIIAIEPNLNMRNSFGYLSSRVARSDSQ